MNFEEYDKQVMDRYVDFRLTMLKEFMKVSRGHGNPKIVMSSIDIMIRHAEHSNYIFRGFSKEFDEKYKLV